MLLSPNEMGQLTFTISPWRASISSPIIPITNLALTIPPSSSSSSAIPLKLSCSSSKSGGIAARDRVVDFGKYKGKMLGSLPSAYLKWVSKNLRAGETEEWAKMADNVLEDPVYRDRVEWEAAEKILNGDRGSRCSGRNAVSELLEISESFGWDNEDKIGWSRIDFGLLGTSKGGRIPRVGNKNAAAAAAGVGILNKKKKKTMKEEENEGVIRRRERRERLKGKTLINERRMEEEEEEEGGGSSEGVVRRRSPFPGREALLKEVLINRRGIGGGGLL